MASQRHRLVFQLNLLISNPLSTMMSKEEKRHIGTFARVCTLKLSGIFWYRTYSDEDYFHHSVQQLDLFNRKRKRPEDDAHKTEKEEADQQQTTAELAMMQLNGIKFELSEAKRELSELIETIKHSKGEEKSIEKENVQRKVTEPSKDSPKFAMHMEVRLLLDFKSHQPLLLVLSLCPGQKATAHRRSCYSSAGGEQRVQEPGAAAPLVQPLAQIAPALAAACPIAHRRQPHSSTRGGATCM